MSDAPADRGALMVVFCYAFSDDPTSFTVPPGWTLLATAPCPAEEAPPGKPGGHDPLTCHREPCDECGPMPAEEACPEHKITGYSSNGDT